MPQKEPVNLARCFEMKKGALVLKTKKRVIPKLGRKGKGKAKVKK